MTLEQVYEKKYKKESSCLGNEGRFYHSDFVDWLKEQRNRDFKTVKGLLQDMLKRSDAYKDNEVACQELKTLSKGVIEFIDRKLEE